ncbi:hydroxymethylglutaryl-CoA synthase [Brevibacterium atlanticum]|uniref:hydroxymethylglutaryl-CoA synthase n=1 Tax=Brevibacterium atlanticum TaxID=2697563 RepID=UPI001420AEE6|nr:hydroxymethylglutaryl-CoA synthase [Brevibacterium atlanticum]
MRPIGIDDIELATAHHVVDLSALAEAAGTDPNKFRLGLGQDQFSFPAPDEDAVTMGAAAAAPIIERCGTEGIRTLLFATESGIDQSKAAGISVHKLLGLPSQVRITEFKEACFAGTAALQAAIGIVSRNPGERVLVIASDVARYELDSPGEPTQGAGAVAMLVSADPRLIEIEQVSGLFAADVDDFWRPNDSTTAIVDGGLSVTAYLDALSGAWDDLQAQGGPALAEIDRILYHQPFTKMAKKAQLHLAQHAGEELSGDLPEIGADGIARVAAQASDAPRDTGLATSTLYNRRLGNTYTASVFAALAALLDHDEDLEGRRIGFFSYGSGSASEFFTGRVLPGYAARSRRDDVAAALDGRVPLDVDAYRELHSTVLGSAEDVETPRVTSAPFRFAGVKGRARVYERS